MNLKIGTFLVILALTLVFPPITQARVTPEDIVNSKREAYEIKVKNYSSQNQENLKNISDSIAQVNKKRADQLDKIMAVQAAILDEYLRRHNGKNSEATDKARYWVTFAHEAVAYQAAKIYIFDLRGEASIKNDMLSTISLFQSDLNSTRSKVIYSQEVLKRLVKK